MKNGTAKNEKEEINLHRPYAKKLAQAIHSRKEYNEKDKHGKPIKYRLNVHCFLMDMRGRVVWLYSKMSDDPSEPLSKKTK